MKHRTSTFLAATLTAGALWLGTIHSYAQDDAPPPPPPPDAAPGGGPGGPGGGGPGGNREDGRERFRQQMNERFKTQLKASNDEWAVIQPLLEKVEVKTGETMGSRFGGMRGGPGGGGGGPRRGGGGGGAGGGNTADANRPGGNNQEGNRPRPPGREPSPEAKALTETLQNDNATTNDIKAKLQALREQRKKSEAELTQAREDLKKVLSMRQEAVLVSVGLLD